MAENSESGYNNDVSILVLSCDAYKDLWRPFFHCFFKYWPDCPYPVYLASNTQEYSEPGMKTILYGSDRDYSSNLLQILEQISSPWVITWVEDAFITSRINNARVLKLIKDAQNARVGYQKLIASYPWAYTNDRSQMAGPLPKGIKYRSGFGMALWNKETLIKLLRPGESAWQIDRNTRSDSFNEPFYALSTNVRSNPPLPVINSVIKGKWNYGASRFLKKEGLEDCIPGRKTIPLKLFLYMKLYGYRLDAFRILRKYWHD